MKGNEPVAPEGGDARSQAVRGISCAEGSCELVQRLEKELARHKREEPVLRDMERRYLALLDSPLLVMMIVLDGRVLFMNRRGEEFFGFFIRERPRFPLLDYVAPGCAASVEQVVSSQRSDGGTGHRLVFSVRCEDGRERTLDCGFVHGVYLGEPVLFATGYELPDREEEVARPDACLGLTLGEDEGLSLCCTDGGGIVSFLTAGFKSDSARIWGAMATEGDLLPGLLPAVSMDDPFRLAFERACAGDAARIAVEAAGTVFICSLSPIYTEEGKFMGVYLCLADRGELLGLEENLRTEAESFGRLFSMSQEMLLLASSTDGRILQGSTALLSFTGLSGDELFGMTEEDLGLFEGAEERELVVRGLTGDGGVSEFDAELTSADGGLAPVRVAAAVVATGGRECVLYLLRHETSEEYECRGEERESDVPPVPVAEAAMPGDEAAEILADAGPWSLLNRLEDVRLCVLDSDCRFASMTKGFESVGRLLWDRAPAEGESILDVLQPGPGGEWLRTGVERARRGEVVRIGRESGDSYFSFSLSPVFDAPDRPSAFLLEAEDLTALRALERECRAEGDKFRRLCDASFQPVAVASARTGAILQCNKAFLSRLGLAEASVQGRTFEELELFADPARSERLLRDPEDASAERMELELRSSSGEVLSFDASVRRVESGEDDLLLYVLAEKTGAATAPLAVEPPRPRQEEAPSEVERAGIPDRDEFLRLLDQELGLTRRYKTHMSLVLVCLDDPGKPDEVLGMKNRERALGELLSALKGRLRPTDHIGRWNLAVLAVLTPMSGPIALQEAEAIRELASRIRLRGEVKVKPSVGVAEYRVDLSTGELVKKAEEALAAARRAGGNRIVLAPFR